MTKASAVAGLAEWMRKGSGALMVVVVRVDDLAIAADPQLAPRDTVTLLEDRMPEIHAQLQAARVEWLAKLDRQREKSLRR
jgi:hypothetical protein